MTVVQHPNPDQPPLQKVTVVADCLDCGVDLEFTDNRVSDDGLQLIGILSEKIGGMVQ